MNQRLSVQRFSHANEVGTETYSPGVFTDGISNLSCFPRLQTKMEGKLEQEETRDQPVLSRLTEKTGGQLIKKTEQSFNFLPAALSTSLSPSIAKAAHT